LFIYPPQQPAPLKEAKEIIEPTPEEGEEGGAQGDEGEGEGNPEDEESDVDPNDPLYGLDERLKNLDLDDEAKRIIK